MSNQLVHDDYFKLYLAAKDYFDAELDCTIPEVFQKKDKLRQVVNEITQRLSCPPSGGATTGTQPR